jgi:energy-coupling factor transporter ATP-binding protein EcfA2
MLKRLSLRNFTVFQESDFDFAPTLNVIVGENGAGKTHILKTVYSAIAGCFEERRKVTLPPTKTVLQTRIADKLENVFRPEYLGRLARRRQGRERCDVSLYFARRVHDISFSFASNSKREVNIRKLPSSWISVPPAYLPTRELLSMYPNFVSFYDGHYLEFEETWRDTCVLLGRPLQRGPKEATIGRLLQPLEEAMNGHVELDRNGRFYLRTQDGRLEMPLVAEGIRKLAMLSRLVATGALLEQGNLLWDEPEANLNPALIRQVAKSIVEIAETGVQVFVATHSLFLLRELEIQMSSRDLPMKGRFFGLEKIDTGGVTVHQSDSIDEIGNISALEEELKQSDRFLELQERVS